jgi:hypothetical protein
MLNMFNAALSDKPSTPSEQAGIIKPGCDAVVSGNIGPIKVFEDQCLETGASLHIVDSHARPLRGCSRNPTQGSF